MEKKPWERQPTDTPKSWEAFKLYRDMGPLRSLRKLQKEHYIKRPSMVRQSQGWSSKYNWVERCADWETYQDDLFVKEKLAKKKEFDKKRIRDGIKLYEKGFEVIKLKKNVKLKAKTGMDLMETGAKFVTGGLGEPDEKIQVSGIGLVVNFPESFKEKEKNK